MAESEEGRRYRLLAIKAGQTATRATDDNIRRAFEEIARQYETLAVTADRLADRDAGPGSPAARKLGS